MSPPPVFPSFDGLLTLARRDGVDIRPTLLRVLTDLYVQNPVHSADEERQFVELASRLIDEVDDATRAMVRARLAIYPAAPDVLCGKLGIARMATAAEALPPVSAAPTLAPEETPAPLPRVRGSAFSPEAHSINDIFLTASSPQRVRILAEIDNGPIPPVARIDPTRSAHSAERLEQAAMAGDRAAFATELGATLIIPNLQVECIIEDAGGEMLAIAARAVNMPMAAFQRVLLFLNPAIGRSVSRVYALTQFYEGLSERTALIMLAIWRGAMVHMARAKHRPLLHDDEIRRARAATPAARPSARAPLATPGARGSRNAG